MNIYEYFNSKTIEQYWRDNHIEPTTWDILRIVYKSDKTWAEKRAALEEILREREHEPFPEEVKAFIEDKIESLNEFETIQKESVFWENLDTSSLSAYVRQFMARMEEIESIKEKDGEGGLSAESFHMLADKYGAETLFFFLPISPNMKKHPFEKGDILLDNFDYRVVANEDEVYRIKSDKGDVELTSDWDPLDCERVKTTSWDKTYGGYYNDTTDDFDDCPTALTLISDFLVGDMDMAELLNNWNWALEQDFPKKKDENAFTEE